MANRRDQGMKDAAKYYEENMKMCGELRLGRAITDEQIEIMGDPKRAPAAKLPRIEDAVKAGGFLCGNADDLIEHIKALEKKYPGLYRVSVSLSVGVRPCQRITSLHRWVRSLRRNGHAKEYDAYQDLSCRSASAAQRVGGHARATCQRRGDR